MTYMASNADTPSPANLPHVFRPAIEGMDLCKCGRFKSHEIHVGGDHVDVHEPEPELVGG